MSAPDLLFALAAGGFNVLVAAVAWRLGHRAGFRRWTVAADRAYALGVQHGRREEREQHRRDPLLDDGEEWKRGGR